MAKLWVAWVGAVETKTIELTRADVLRTLHTIKS